MVRLNIRQQPAKLEFSITDPSISIRTQAPRLEIDTEPAIVEISQPRGTLEIDQSPCRASYGYKKMDQLNRDFAQEGRQAALEAIGKMAQDGDRMARIESKEDVIVALAVEASVPEPLEVGIVPIDPPYIRYYPHSPEYKVTPAKIDMQYYPGTVDVQLNRGEINAAITQYQSIRMWISNNYDLSV